MPKENTHLYFAHQVVEVLPDEKLANLIRQEMGCFYFGAVMPDTFYYSSNRQIISISEFLHGKEGNPTNEFAFDLLKKAKETRSEKDLVFALGFITHCVLDIVFHPVIYYLSGNYYNKNLDRRDDAVYLHRHLETALDRRVNQSFYFANLIRLSYLDELTFDEVLLKKFAITRGELIKTLKNKALLLRFLNHDWLYYVLYALHSTGLMKSAMLLGIFYGNLRHDDRQLPEYIEYKDLVTGAPLNTTIQDLFYKARHLANSRVQAGYDYFLGNIKRAEAEKIILGESLSTGKVGVPVSDIKYFYNS